MFELEICPPLLSREGIRGRIKKGQSRTNENQIRRPDTEKSGFLLSQE